MGGWWIAVAACVSFNAVTDLTTNVPLLLLSSVQFLHVSGALMSVVRFVLVIRERYQIGLRLAETVYILEMLPVVES